MHRTLVALGCVLALAGGSALAQQSGDDASVKDKAKTAARTVGEKTKEAVVAVKEAAKETAGKVKEAAKDTGAKAKEVAKDTGDKAKETGAKAKAAVEPKKTGTDTRG
jgi:NAD+--asparagine ADP-ribosyltransferase